MHASLPLPFMKVSDYAILPRRATGGSAAFDLYLPLDTSAHVGVAHSEQLPNRTVCPTGVAVAIPEGYVGLVCPRSGLSAKHGLTITNSPGIIDSDYRGEIKVILQNTGDTPISFNPGSRIGQLLVVEAPYFHVVEVSSLDVTKRGTGGLGSTGE